MLRSTSLSWELVTHPCLHTLKASVSANPSFPLSNFHIVSFVTQCMRKEMNWILKLHHKMNIKKTSSFVINDTVKFLYLNHHGFDFWAIKDARKSRKTLFMTIFWIAILIIEQKFNNVNSNQTPLILFNF
jgi:hypothetical protein